MSVRHGAVLLGGYEATHCPVRTWWDHTPGAWVEWVPDDATQRRLDAGNDFEERVVDDLVAMYGLDAVIVEGRRGGDLIDNTVAAMAQGTMMVVGGELPRSTRTARVGLPDILLRVTPKTVPPKYVPVDVKNYRQFGKDSGRSRNPVTASTLADPLNTTQISTLSENFTSRFKAAMQLAHYTRMLQEAGFHPGSDWMRGAIIGNIQLGAAIGSEGGPGWALAWIDLDAPTFKTYSRSTQGAVNRSAMERYDHEFGFRVEVARTAATGGERPVEPIRQAECNTCPYWETCKIELHGRASNDITSGALTVREWQALQRVGVTTTVELANFDSADASVVENLAAEVEGTPEALEKRLATAIRRARLITAGEPWEQTRERVVVPTADIEIDVDMENQEFEGLVYMWGVRVRDGQDENTAAYLDEFHTFDPLNRASATELTLRYFRWMQTQIAAADLAGKTVSFFHWTHPEISKLRSHLTGSDVTKSELDAVIARHVDLNKFFNDHFFAVHGSGLKPVARALGFAWESGDAGGDASLGQVDKAQNGDVRARQWLLHYNRNDVEATAFIRDRLRERGRLETN